MIYAALPMRAQTEKTTFLCKVAKTTSARLYIYIEVGSRDLFIDEAHTALCFAVFFPCMLPRPVCGIFYHLKDYTYNFILSCDAILIL